MCGISKPLWYVADMKLICGAPEKEYHGKVLDILVQHFRRLGINASVVSNTAEDSVNKSTFYLVLTPLIGEKWRPDYNHMMEKYHNPPFLAPTHKHVSELDHVDVYQLPEHGQELLARILGRPNCTSFSRVSWQKVGRDIEDLEREIKDGMDQHHHENQKDRKPTRLDSISVVMKENAKSNEEDVETVIQYDV
jgi:hypothetical protein